MSTINVDIEECGNGFDALVEGAVIALDDELYEIELVGSRVQTAQFCANWICCTARPAPEASWTDVIELRATRSTTVAGRFSARA